jgi:hypothetical protein
VRKHSKTLLLGARKTKPETADEILTIRILIWERGSCLLPCYVTSHASEAFLVYMHEECLSNSRSPPSFTEQNCLSPFVQQPTNLLYPERGKSTHCLFGALSQNCEKLLLASSCPSVRLFAWKNWAPTGADFQEILREFFRKYVQKFQVSLKSDKNNRHFT